MYTVLLTDSTRGNVELTSLPANIMATTLMQCVSDDRTISAYKGDQPVIMTTNENGRVRASAVLGIPGDRHMVLRTFFQGSLAESDIEALLSLYEETKRMTTNLKAALESKGLYVGIASASHS